MVAGQGLAFSRPRAGSEAGGSASRDDLGNGVRRLRFRASRRAPRGLAEDAPSAVDQHDRAFDAPSERGLNPNAEREGFEPSNEVDPRYAISSRARSTAPAPLRARGEG